MFLGINTPEEYSVSFGFIKNNIPGFWSCRISFKALNKEFPDRDIYIFDTEEQINETALRVTKKMLQELTK